MSIGLRIHEIQPFQNLTLKIQYQGHGWGQRSRSYSGFHIVSFFIHANWTIQHNVLSHEVKMFGRNAHCERCVHIKWICLVLRKAQCGQNFVHRRKGGWMDRWADGQSDFSLIEAGKITMVGGGSNCTHNGVHELPVG